MATSEHHDSPTDATAPAGDASAEAAARRVEAAAAAQTARLDQVVTPAGDAIASNTEELVVSDSEEPTQIVRPIPPLLIDEPAADAAVASAGSDARGDTKDRDAVAGAAASVQAAAAAAATSKEGDADGSASSKADRGSTTGVAKDKSPSARQRISAAASGAKGRASSAASDARERASSTDVKEFAHSTTSLIDTARPFFLAGCAAIFAVLAFLEGDAGTAQVFAVGALLFVVGAAFSGEINAYLASHSHSRDKTPRGDG